MPRPRFDKLTPERQATILDAATVEFATAGYENASLNRIIERAELSKGATYYYFDGKEDLYLTVLSNAMEKVTASVGLPSAEGSRNAFWRELEWLTRQIFRLFLDDPQLAGLIRSLATLPQPKPTSETIAALYEQSRGFIETFVQHGQNRGAIRTDLPFDLVVRAVIGVFDAIDLWVLAHWTEIKERDIERIATITTDLCKRIAAP